MNATLLRSTAALLLPLAAGAQIKNAGLEQMPEQLEVRFALSSLPPALRSTATVYRLDVKNGYVVAKQGSSGVTCLVQRTAWEAADFRDDIYVPRCYDAAGSETYVKVLRDVAKMRIDGMSPDALKAEIEARFRDGRYTAPKIAGLSYMLAPLMRSWLPPDNLVHTVPAAHVMFYAPNIGDKEIGAQPEASHAVPFTTEEGVPQQTFIIQLAGSAETAAILKESAQLVTDLCAYRNVLCLKKPAS